jgi:hypothetical protein
MCVVALSVMGCSEGSGDGGSGGGGSGGTNLCEDVTCEDDGNECTEDPVCDPADGMCDYAPVEDGTACGAGPGECEAGVCVGGVFGCTEQGVRDAIEVGGGPHTFDCGDGMTVVTEAVIVIDNDVVLDGEGSLTVDGNGVHRVFFVSEGVTAELRGFRITNGFHEESLDGGGIRDGGAGILNSGTLAVTDSTVSGNSLGPFPVRPGPGGGGIFNHGTMTLTNSTVSDNSAKGDLGAGISNSGTMTLTNSTVSENSADDGIGIQNWGTMTVTNSLVEGDCGNTRVASGGYNIESPGDTCGFDQPTDQSSVTAEQLNLGPLQDNGGPTMTHALLIEPTASVAIDVIPADDCEVDADQRGEPRPSGPESKCDVGSFELQVPFACTEQGIRDAIAQGGGPHTFDCDGPQTIVTKAEIVIDNEVTLDGNGDLTVDGDDDHRVFSVAEGTTAELRGFVLTKGLASVGSAPAYTGGCIWNGGDLTLANSTLSQCFAEGGGDALPGASAIDNGGTMTIYDSTLVENEGDQTIANSGAMTMTRTTVSRNDDGILNFASLMVIDSVIANNGFADRPSSIPADAGIRVDGDGASLSLANSTVSGNISQDGENKAVVNSGNGSLALVNSTISGRVENDDQGALTVAGSVLDGVCESEAEIISGGYNIESPGDTCGFDQTGDQAGVNADDLKLGELADNGGPTETRALGEGSVAIDQIPEVECVDADGEPLTTDQRGEPRDSMCDVGAFEVQP